MMTEFQYYKELEYLEQDLADGYISEEEFRQWVRELNQEMGPDTQEW
jgi:cytochrome c-type biogenesis protein CcmH/NrfG